MLDARVLRADVVHRSSERLLRLAEEILEFSGLESGQAVLRREPFDVRALVEGVADWAVPLGEARGLSVSVVVDESARHEVSATAGESPRS